MPDVHENIAVAPVPIAMMVPAAMQAAQERLLGRFSGNVPQPAGRLQNVVNTETSALLFAVLGNAPEAAVDWHRLKTEHYIGTLSLLGVESTTRLSGHIDHVVIDERYEGRGIGELLVRAAISTATAIGMSRLDLTSGQSKLAAQRLYAKTGFQRRDTNNWRLEL